MFIKAEFVALVSLKVPSGDRLSYLLRTWQVFENPRTGLTEKLLCVWGGGEGGDFFFFWSSSKVGGVFTRFFFIFFAPAYLYDCRVLLLP